MSITNDDHIEKMRREKAEQNATTEVDDTAIPDHRSFNLYIMLFVGIVVYGLAVYLYFYPAVNERNKYFDGERFVEGKLNWQSLCFVATLISAFPVYHLLKGSHKVKRKN